MKKILIVDDEQDIVESLKFVLEVSGFMCYTAFNGEDGLKLAKEIMPDLIILDVMMPKKDGFQVVKEYRKNGGKAPVLFLTARASVEDRVYGLDLGANDYLVKPFSFAELMARVRAMTRKNSDSVSNIFTLGDLTVDISAKRVTRGNREIRLSSREFALLEYMIKNAGRVLSREQIENNLYNFDYEGGTNVIDVYIRYLRKKIDEGFDDKLIHTVRGSGYVLREEK